MPNAATADRATAWDGVDRRACTDPAYCGPLRRAADAVRRKSHDPKSPLDASLDYLAGCIDRLDTRLDGVDSRLDKGGDRMDAMQAELTANTAVTTEVRELLAAARSGLRVLGWIGSAGLWTVKAVGILAATASAVWALWQTIKTGQPPVKP